MASPASSAPRPTDAGSADPQSAPAEAATPARVNCEVIAVTTSDEFLLELGELVGAQASLRPVESLDGALEHLGSSRRAQLIAFDIRGVPEVREAIERARAAVPHITVLAFADISAESAATSNLQGSDVFALLPIPVDRRKTTAALEGALAATEKRGAARSASGKKPAAAITVTTQGSEASRAQTTAGGQVGASGSWRARLISPLVLIPGGIAVVLALAATVWLFMRGSGEAEIRGIRAAPAAAAEDMAEAGDIVEAELQATPQEISLVQGSLDELLEKARLAMRQRRFTEPEGDNALVYFRSAIALDGSNAEATDGLARIGGVLVARVEEAFAANRMDEATADLAAAKSAIAGDARLAALEGRLLQAQVSAALAEGNLDRAAGLARVAQKTGTVPADLIGAWRADIARRQSESRVKRAVELAGERLRDGRLVEPANDSARHYVRELRDLAPTSAVTQRLAKELVNACLRKARESSLAGRSTEADKWLTEAQGVGATAAQITTFQNELAVARQRAAAAEGDRIAQLARERIEEGRLIEPADDSAAHYLNALRAAEQSHDSIAPIRRELAAKLIDRAENAVREGRTTQSEADLAAARRLGADAKAIQAVQQLAVNARAESGAARRASMQQLLKRTRNVAPEYPPRALDRGISGSVTLEYVVDVNGEPRDFKVTASEPEGLFDRAALSAVRRWRYEPVVVDEVPVEIPTRTIVRFEAPKE